MFSSLMILQSFMIAWKVFVYPHSCSQTDRCHQVHSSFNSVN